MHPRSADGSQTFLLRVCLGMRIADMVPLALAIQSGNTNPTLTWLAWLTWLTLTFFQDTFEV